MAPARVGVAEPLSLLLLFFLLLLGAGTSSVVAGAAEDPASFVYAGCSQGRYGAGTQYESGVDSVLTSLANSAPFAPYANTTSPASSAVSGLYQCRSDLASSVCTACVRSAIARLSALCAWSSGGAVQLRGCFVRYGNDSFVGKPNTAVLFKKCGGGESPGGAAMRDSALGALASEAMPPGYRAGGAGAVQAMAQCVGDLDAKACSDCVSACAAQLKAGCGYAGAGEVYLGKCYARFWSNGGGFVSSGAGAANGDRLASLAVAGGFLAYLSLALI